MNKGQESVIQEILGNFPWGVIIFLSMKESFLTLNSDLLLPLLEHDHTQPYTSLVSVGPAPSLGLHTWGAPNQCCKQMLPHPGHT